MSYHVRRIDPYWFRNPLIVVMAVGGVLLGLIGLLTGAGGGARGFVTIAGFVLTGLGVLLLTKPTVSVALGTLGMIGGLFTFVILPNVQTADLSMFFKFVAAILFGLFYTVLMDSVVLVAVFFYNLFSLMMGGIQVDLEESSDGDES